MSVFSKKIKHNLKERQCFSVAQDYILGIWRLIIGIFIYSPLVFLSGNQVLWMSSGMKSLPEMLISAFAWRLIITLMQFREFKILIATVYECLQPAT